MWYDVNRSRQCLSRSIILVVIFLNSSVLLAQKRDRFFGFVKDKAGVPLEFAAIHYKDRDVSTISNEKGAFSFQINPEDDEITVVISFVGRKTLEKKFKKSEFGVIHHFILEELSLTIDDVSVQGRRQAESSSNSSIVFDRQAIEQVQAFNLMDVMNTLPGKATIAPDLHRSQTLTLRSAQDGVFDFSNSFGISILMDGIAINDNANMQSMSLSHYGMAGSILGGARGNAGTDVPYQGVDLRDIPVENIESIEVIQGVASAKYSDLTDGAVIIERQAGRTSYNFGTNVNGGSISNSLSKGFALGRKAGALNVSTNYSLSNNDPRDKVNRYGKLSQSVMWTKNFGSAVKNTLSVDYDQRLDEVKEDPDDDTKQKSHSKNKGFRVSNRFNLTLSEGFVRSVGVSSSFSARNQDTYKQWLLNGLPKPYANKDTTGIYEGYYIPGNYMAVEHVLGKPRNASVNVNVASVWRSGGISHNLSYGASYSYANNGGKGIIADPDKPRWVNRGGQNDRPYNFSYNPASHSYGIYIENAFKFNLFGKEVSTRAGLRKDIYNGKTGAWQPRINSTLKLSEPMTLNIAYGISTKSPSLAHRYPSPSWLDIPLLQVYTGYADESLYLVYTHKTVPDNSHLESSRSDQMEVGVTYRNDNFRSSLFTYVKKNKNGFNSIADFKQILLPVFDYQVIPGQKVSYFETGEYRLYSHINDFKVGNTIQSDNMGIEWMFDTRRFEAIQTAFSFSTNLSYSRYFNNANRMTSVEDTDFSKDERVLYAVYPPEKNERLALMSKVASNTHIPKIGFIVSFNADVFWTEFTKRPADSGHPIAYINREMEYKEIAHFDVNHPVYGFLTATPRDQINTYQYMIYGIVNMSVAKEVRKNWRLSITAYNAFNLHPEHYRIRADGTEEHFVYNRDLSVTGGISIRF